MILKTSLFLIFLLPFFCFGEENSHADLFHEKQKIINSKNVLRFFIKKYKKINLKEEKVCLISHDFIHSLNRNLNTHKDLTLMILRDIVFDKNCDIIKHNLKLVPNEFEFYQLRYLILYGLAAPSKVVFDDILVDYYYNKILNNKKILSPKEKFLWACKHTTTLPLKNVYISKVTKKNRSDNTFELFITYYKSGILFRLAYLLREYKKGKNTFWIPLKSKFVGESQKISGLEKMSLF